MAYANGKATKAEYITQNGFTSDAEEVQEVLNNCDEGFGVTVVKDMKGKVLFLCVVEFMQRIRDGEFTFKYNEDYAEAFGEK